LGERWHRRTLHVYFDVELEPYLACIIVEVGVNGRDHPRVRRDVAGGGEAGERCRGDGTPELRRGQRRADERGERGALDRGTAAGRGHGD
jgi:hypothetical protein